MRLALAAIALSLVAGAAAAEALQVPIDQSARVRLSGPAQDVVVANPAVADVNMLDARNLVVLGKQYGVTNLIVVDGLGRTILDRNIVVVAPPEGRMSFYRGGEVRTYACAPDCERAERAEGGGGAVAGALGGDAAPPTP